MRDKMPFILDSEPDISKFDADEMSSGEFEEMLDLAMHANLVDAYHYFAKEYLRMSGQRNMILNEALNYNYWKSKTKIAIDFLFNESNKNLADRFMDFFDDEDHFKTKVLFYALRCDGGGERCWNYWVVIGWWKMAEHIMKNYFVFYDGYGWESNGKFDLEKVKELSNVNVGTPVYSKRDMELCASRVKDILMGMDRGDEAVHPVGEDPKSSELESLKKEMQAEIDKLKKKFAGAVSERDEALQKVDMLEGKLSTTEADLKVANNKAAEHVPVNHDILVGEVFCEIAQRYLECMKNKEVRMRTEAKHCLNSIMEELKLHDRVPRDVRACINRFDDMTPPDIPQIIIKEYVLEKNVETEVQNVESGGNGVTINKK